jgi:hypothetical protein
MSYIRAPASLNSPHTGRDYQDASSAGMISERHREFPETMNRTTPRSDFQIAPPD